MKQKKGISLSKKILRYFFAFIISCFIVGVCGLVIFIMVVNHWLKDVPEIDISQFKTVAQTSYLYDKNGDIITAYSDSENRDWVSIDEIPDTLQKAFVAVEDKRFYSHQGFDIKRLGGAILNQLLRKDVYGGSTITQQLIKNTILNDDPTYKRKVQELYLAVNLEKKMSKTEILEAYLNIIYLGGPNYGVKTAAQDYFGKDLNELTLKECALLAGLTKNPYALQPIANMYYRNSFDKNEQRIQVVLKAMKSSGYITEEEYQNALNEEIHIQQYSSSSNMYHYGHFVEYAINDVIEGFLVYRNLEDTEENRKIIEDEIRIKGYSIYTTLDPDIQNTLQETVKNYDNYPNFSEGTENLSYEIDPLQPQVAAVIIDQHTGEIVSMVGSRTEPTIKKSFNRATRSIMSIGSTIKPIAVFGPAFDLGYSPATIEYDYPSSILGYDLKNSYPQKSKTTNAPITLRNTLIYSYNIPTARTLCYDVGYSTSAAYLNSLGVKTSALNETGSGLALGSVGINMLDLTGAYSALANKGEYLEPRSYTIVTDANGNTILNSDLVKSNKQIYKPSTAYLITDILEDVVNYGTGQKAQISGMNVAGKTGTNEQNSITFAGYTPYYTSALWIGHDASLDFYGNVEADDYAAPLWQAYMSKIHKGLENKEIIDSTDLNIVEATVCSISGKLATDACGTNVITDMFDADNVPTELCDLHKTISLCTITNQKASDYCPTIKTITGIIVPVDSELNSINHEILKANLNDVIFEEDLLIGDSEVCSVHTENYVTISASKIREAKNLKSNFEYLLEHNIFSEQTTENINIHISNLDYLISTANRISQAENTESFAYDFDKFYNNAKEYYDNIVGN